MPEPGGRTVGNLALLERRTLALFCSVRCPGRLVLQSYELTRRLRDAGVTVIGGFQSPMEQECLRLLLSGAQPVIVCRAGDVSGVRQPGAWRAAIAAGRLLVLSPPGARRQRVTAELAAARNAYVASLADTLFAAYAEPGGKTERLCRDALAAGKPVLTFHAPENAHLLHAGAQPLDPAFDWQAWTGAPPPLASAPLFG